MPPIKLSKQEVQRRQRTKSGLLDVQIVAHIKWRLLQGHDKRQMAAEYGVALGTIRAIARGDTWEWVDAAFGGDPGELTQSTNRLTGLMDAGQPSAEQIAASQAKFLAKLADQQQPPPEPVSAGMDKLQRMAADKYGTTNLDELMQNDDDKSQQETKDHEVQKSE